MPNCKEIVSALRISDDQGLGCVGAQKTVDQNAQVVIMHSSLSGANDTSIATSYEGIEERN